MSPKSRIFLIVILVAHVVLASWYAAITPYRQAGRLVFQGGAPSQDIGAPDERQHANYVQRLLDGKGFGVLDPKDPNLYENYQAHQPPLFYVLAAGWSKAVGVSDVTAKDSGFRLRLLNVLIGAGTVCGVFFLGLWGTRREDIALGAAVFAGFLPMHAALNGAFSNDPLLFCISSWSLALMARLITEGPNLRLALLAGALCGLGALTKTNAIGLLPALVAAIWLSKNPGSGKADMRVGVAAVTAALLVPAAWWVRNMSIYGDPLAMSAFNEAFVGTAQASMFINEPSIGMMGYWRDWVGWWTVRSFVGAFGYMDIFLPSPLYAVTLFVTFFLSVFGSLKALNRETDRSLQSLFPVWIFLAVVVLLFIRFNLQYFQGQARYLLPAVSAFALLVSLGLTKLRSESTSPLVAGLAAALIGLNLYVLMTLPGEFALRAQ